jgi:hypothetical protein
MMGERLALLVLLALISFACFSAVWWAIFKMVYG